MIIGGGMAFTFKKTLENMKIGDSLFDEEGAKIAAEIMAEAKAKNVEILLPEDWTIADKFAPDANTKTVTDKEGIPDGWMGLDAGPKTIEKAKGVRNLACAYATGYTGVLALSFKMALLSVWGAVCDSDDHAG